MFEQITNSGGFAALREIADTFKTKQHTGFWDVLATPFFQTTVIRHRWVCLMRLMGTVVLHAMTETKNVNSATNRTLNN